MSTKLTIQVDPELRRRAKEAAAVQGRTLSEVVRAALVALVEDEQVSDQPLMMEIDPIFQMAGKLSGSTENVSP